MQECGGKAPLVRSVSSSLPPPTTTRGPPPPIPSPPLCSSPATPPFPLLPLHHTFSSRTPRVGAFGAAVLRILRSGVGGGDLLPPCSRTPSSHVLGRSARPPGGVITVAAAAEPPARAVSTRGTRQGEERRPGEAGSAAWDTGRLATTHSAGCTVSHALDS